MSEIARYSARMKTFVQALILLGVGCTAAAAEPAAIGPVAPGAPPFFALSVPDAPASARWYQLGFRFVLLRDPDGNYEQLFDARKS